MAKNSNAVARVHLKKKLNRFSWNIHYSWLWSPTNLLEKAKNEPFYQTIDLINLAMQVEGIVAVLESLEQDILNIELDLTKFSSEIKKIKNNDIGNINFIGLPHKEEINLRERKINFLQNDAERLLKFEEVTNYRRYLKELADIYYGLVSPNNLVQTAYGQEVAAEIAKEFRADMLETYNIDLADALTSGAGA